MGKPNARGGGGIGAFESQKTRTVMNADHRSLQLEKPVPGLRFATDAFRKRDQFDAGHAG